MNHHHWPWLGARGLGCQALRSAQAASGSTNFTAGPRSVHRFCLAHQVGNCTTIGAVLIDFHRFSRHLSPVLTSPHQSSSLSSPVCPQVCLFARALHHLPISWLEIPWPRQSSEHGPPVGNHESTNKLLKRHLSMVMSGLTMINHHWLCQECDVNHCRQASLASVTSRAIIQRYRQWLASFVLNYEPSQIISNNNWPPSTENFAVVRYCCLLCSSTDNCWA